MKKGFTLIEILLAAGMATIILVGLYSVFIVSTRIHRHSTNQQELAQNARITLERISRDIRQTERIVTDLPNSSTDPLNPAPDNIQFQDGHSNNKIQYIRYYKDEENLKRQIVHYYFEDDPDVWVAWNAVDHLGQPALQALDEDVIKANKVQSIYFFGDKVININLTVIEGDTSFTFTTAIFGRNI